jgi:hypothetical protein
MNLQGQSLWQNSQFVRKEMMTGDVPKHQTPDALGRVSLDHNKHIHIRQKIIKSDVLTAATMGTLSFLRRDVMPCTLVNVY